MEKKRLVLDEVLSSETLARSEQLRKFLRHVCELEMAGRSGEITEYSIGVQALGRPAEFSPNEDSAVRGRAHELRQKLQRFYAQESPKAAVRIEFLKGSYVPHFIETDSAVPAAREPAETPSTPGKPSRWISVGAAFLGLGGIVALAAALYMLSLSRQIDPMIEEAWGPLVRPDGNVLICLGTNLYLIVRPELPSIPAIVPRFDAPAELYAEFRKHRPLAPGTHLEMHPSDGPIPIEEASGVLAAAAVLRQAGTRFQLLPERVAPIGAMRDRNVILLGVPHSSQATSEYLNDVPIILKFEPELEEMILEDRSISPARRFAPVRNQQNAYAEVFGLITVLPSRGTGAANARTVVISGITSVGSHGAMEFFASPDSLRDLKQRFQKEGLRGFPRAYQVVVQCKTNDTLLLGFRYAAHKVISR